MTIQKQLLQSLAGNDTLTLEEVAELHKMIRRKKIEALHPYKILYNKNRAAWYTCAPDDYHKKIQRKTRDSLLDALAPYYQAQTVSDELTLSVLYPEWLEYKSQITDSPNTIATHQKHWRKYFKDTALFEMPLGKITLKDLNLWANALIKQHDLSSKQWQTIRTIPKQMFEYAYMCSYIADNIFPLIRVTVKFRQVVKKTGDSETFTSDEYQLLLNDLALSYDKKHESRFLAVALNFYIGLRAGELAALQWQDITENYLHIQREMVCMDAETLSLEPFQCQIQNGALIVLPGQEGKKHPYVLLNHTKTHKERYIPLIPKAVDILKTIRYNSVYRKPTDFIFCDGDKYLTLRSINGVLEYACKHIGIEAKRSHKIRKTYASRLSAAGYPIDAIRENLGHNNLSTTLGYIYNPLTKDENLSIMKNAF